MLLCGDMATKFASPVLMAKSTELSKRNKRRSIRMFKCRAAGADGGRVAVGDDVFSVTTSSKYEVDYLGQSTKGDLNLKLDPLHSFGNGQATLEGPIEEVARTEAQAAENLIRELGIQGPFSAQHSPRGIFCSRTLNLRSISAIGYDMDYTLMHYNVMAWEGRAYDYCMENLKNMGFPVDGLSFDPELVIRGLMIDKEKGNLVKADRFGYVKRAMHGTEMLSNKAVSDIYGRELVDLRNQSRWEFLNTFFSVSEALAYAQMVDRLDDGSISADLGILDYRGLYKAVAKALFRAHVEGQLKSEIMSKPELFVEPDPELPLALLDQKEAGKKLLLITNSDYHYTDKMMKHSFNKFLPNDMDWRDLFDMVIVSARKPEFFQMSHPLYEVVTGEGLMRPCFKAETGGLYSGGSAQMVESSLNVHGDEILYVGDHIYTDVSVSKVHLRWRTALICRELEEEYMALIGSRGHQDPSQSESFGGPSNNVGSGSTIFSQDSVSPIWPTLVQPPFDPFPPPSPASFYGSFFHRSRAHHQGLQFGYEGFGGATPATHHHHEQLRILSEALGPVVQAGSGPFGLQAELGKMTAQEIMDAKALAASKSHSEAERRRRERINNHLAKLRSILPNTTKTDKASLLAEVIQHVKELKKETSVISETNLVPTENDELTVAFTEEEETGDGRFVIKASLCCEDRSDLLPDMIKTLKAMRLKTLKAEITTVGGRVKNVLFVTGDESSGEEEMEEYCIGTIEEALKAVMDKSSVEETSSSGNAKRQRMSSHNSITILEQQQHHR